MSQIPKQLRRTFGAGTPNGCAVWIPADLRATDWTGCGKHIGPGPTGRFSKTTSKISGMISPAFRIKTVSPIRISFSAIKS